MAGSCGAHGAAGFALAPGLWLVIGVAVLGGAGSGMLNLLHGCYGIGAAGQRTEHGGGTVGPTAALAATELPG